VGRGQPLREVAQVVRRCEQLQSDLFVHKEAREAQWEQIKAAGGQGRTCNIYESPGDHVEW
jgi:hypothetical protein